MAAWPRVFTAEIFKRLKDDSSVGNLLASFHEATGVRIWLAPLEPPSQEDITEHARGHPFCRTFASISEKARAHCLHIHSSLCAQPLKPGVIARRTCAAGILHAALPLSIANRPIALLLLSGIADGSLDPAEAIANLERLLNNGNRSAGLPAEVGTALEGTERRLECQIEGILQIVVLLAASLNARALYLSERLEPPALPGTVVRAIDYLKSNFTDANRTAPEIVAKELGVSPRWLRLLFREYLGIGLADWLGRFRVSVAMVKLRSGTEPVIRIAHECGFASLAPFYVAFRKHAQMTPTQWRSSERAPASARSDLSDSYFPATGKKVVPQARRQK